MTDKIEPLNMHGHANTWEEELDEVCRERDALRGEVERLKADVQEWAARHVKAKAENERLRAALRRLIAACEREDWDEPDADLDAARAALAGPNCW